MAVFAPQTISRILRCHRGYWTPWLALAAALLQIVTSLLKHKGIDSSDLDDDFAISLQRARDMLPSPPLPGKTVATTTTCGVKARWNTSPPLPVKVPQETNNKSGRMEIRRENLQRWYISQMKVLVSNCQQPHTAEVRGMYCDAGGVSVSRVIEQSLRQSFCIKRMSSLSLRDRERILTQDNVVKFAVIRHPLVRALAAYRHAVSNNTLPNSETYRSFIARLRGHGLTSDHRELGIVSFRVFLALSGQRLATVRAGNNERPFQIKSGGERLNWDGFNDDHKNIGDESINQEYELSPQWLLCAMDAVNYSSLVRAETMGKDLHVVFRKMSVTTSVVPELNTSMDLVEARRVYSEVRLRQRAWRLFRKDMSTFGYSLTDLTK